MDLFNKTPEPEGKVSVKRRGKLFRVMRDNKPLMNIDGQPHDGGGYDNELDAYNHLRNLRR
jgi:hypothetical protein